jgi:hypothetical protein
MSGVGEADVGMASDSTLMTLSSRLACWPLHAASNRNDSAAVNLGTVVDKENLASSEFQPFLAINSALRREQGSKPKNKLVRQVCNIWGTFRFMRSWVVLGILQCHKFLKDRRD